MGTATRGKPKGSGEKSVVTQEVAQNFEQEVFINCTVCSQVYKLQECLKEEPMPAPYQTVLHGILVCPGCGDRRHCYYLSEHLRFQQAKLTRALQKWHETKDGRDWRAYKSLHDSFQRVFDTCQKKYKALFGEGIESEPRGK